MTGSEDATKERASARRQQKKRHIGITALELIADLGVDNITLRKVARQSNYHPASLYEYFLNKDELLEYVSQLARENFMDYLNDVLSQNVGIEDTLLKLAEVYLNYAKEQPKYFQVMFISLKQDWSNFKPLEEDSPIKFLISTIQDGITSGELRSKSDETAFDIAYHLWSLVHGMALLQQTFFLEYKYHWKETHSSILRQAIKPYLNIAD